VHKIVNISNYPDLSEDEIPKEGERMKKAVMLVMILGLVFAIRNAYAGHSKIDYTHIHPLRWMDPYRNPITYQEYTSSREFAPKLDARLIYAGTKGNVNICIVINANLEPQIQTQFSVYLADLQAEGYNPNIYTAYNDGDVAALKNLLISEWNSRQIAGAILIGDLAVPWYEMNEPSSWGGSHVEFPIDLYFMDLDGLWGDADSDGLFDSHQDGIGNMQADIWVGRLMAMNLTYYGATESGLLNNYFNKNHRYRKGYLRLQDKALAYIDNDWCIYGWENEVAMAYPHTDPVTDPYQTNREDYIQRVRQSTDNQYENLLICSHSSPWAHYLVSGDGNYQLFYNYEIEDIDVQVLFYNLFACSNCRYVEQDDMGDWYLFQSTYGLISLGSTKTGSMLCFYDYYTPLGNGANFGNAFLSWCDNDIESCAGDESRAWFYGMTLLGDPTLKLSRFLPDPTGDVNLDEIIDINDVVYLINYLYKNGPVPDPLRFADPTADCTVDVSDVLFLINYLFRSGPAPGRGCA
jgi:hypothetical protein